MTVTKFMKDHHDCKRINLGRSDIAALIAVGRDNGCLKTKPILFSENGSYSAYLCGKVTEIPDYYKKVFECRAWMKIYDDEGLVFDSIRNSPDYNRFEIYRAGDCGVIIRCIKREKRVVDSSKLTANILRNMMDGSQVKVHNVHDSSRNIDKDEEILTMKHYGWEEDKNGNVVRARFWLSSNLGIGMNENEIMKHNPEVITAVFDD